MNVIVVGGIFAFVVTVFVIVMFHAMGAWVFLPFFLILAGIAGYYVREKLRPPEEIAFEIEERNRRMHEGLEKDQKWYKYLSSTICILCGKAKHEGDYLCEKCCPLCGQKKTKKALICKNCLKHVPRDDMLGLSQAGGLTKREIRIAISRANVPGRIQAMMEAAERGEVLEYGPEMDLGPDIIEDQEIEAAYEENGGEEAEEESKDEDGSIDYEVKGGGEEIPGSGDPEQW